MLPQYNKEKPGKMSTCKWVELETVIGFTITTNYAQKHPRPLGCHRRTGSTEV